MKTYSFIIPHHNTPDLLSRLLDSIPQREDIQIIVVDDNSDEDKKPNILRTDVQLFYIDAEHTLGAGHARNVGLNHAIGKWLLFADADDYYIKDFIKILDAKLQDNLDILYFDYVTNSVDNITKQSKYSHTIQAFLKNKNSKYWSNHLKFEMSTPWNKVFRSDYIKTLQFTFEEIPIGNDIHFVHHAGMQTNRIDAIPDALYCYIMIEGGITKKKRPFSAIKERIKHAASHTRYLQDNNVWDINSQEWPRFGFIAKRYGVVSAIQTLFLRRKYYRNPLIVYYHKLHNKIKFSLNKDL